jgi:hypothetical protein
MTYGYDISLATPNDIPGILALQEPNLPDNGGSLSVRQTAHWFKNAILERSVIAGRRYPRWASPPLCSGLGFRYTQHSYYAACTINISGFDFRNGQADPPGKSIFALRVLSRAD